MTTGRVRRRLAAAATRPVATAPAPVCVLCDRPLGVRVEWHHLVPKSEGGRETAPVHPICHRTIHACATNRELAGMTVAELRERLAGFRRWVAGKPVDFHAPTRGGRLR